MGFWNYYWSSNSSFCLGNHDSRQNTVNCKTFLLCVISCAMKISRFPSSFRRFSAAISGKSFWFWGRPVSNCVDRSSTFSCRALFTSCNLRRSPCKRDLAALSNRSRRSDACTSSSCARWTFPTSCSNCNFETKTHHMHSGK